MHCIDSFIRVLSVSHCNLHLYTVKSEAIRKPVRLADNEVKAFRSGRFLAFDWKAPSKKKSLIMLSTHTSAATAPVKTRHNQGQSEKQVAVVEYNHSMNGVDRADQNSVYYPFIRKTRKWWLYKAWMLTMTPSNICSGLKKCGPFNPNAIACGLMAHSR